MDIIDEVIETEGGDRLTDDPDDPGGRTIYGISEKSNPDLWTNGPPTYLEARQRYFERYVFEPGFNRITFRPLRDELVDTGVNLGPSGAIKLLQQILGLTTDGHLGPQTLTAINTQNPRDLTNAVCLARQTFYTTLAAKQPSKRKFLKGWLARAKRFFLP